MAFTLSENSALLHPVTVGDVAAPNRLFMAPLTRTRA
jgi:N-ethylmaleimide reductase